MRWLVGCLLAGALCTSAQAVVTLRCGARAQYDPIVGAGVDTGWDESAPSCAALLKDANIGIANAGAEAAPGVLKADAYALTGPQVGILPTSTRAEAFAGWDERFTISAPGMNNKFGFFNFSVLLSGHLDSHATSGTFEGLSNLANWRFSLSGGSPAFGVVTGVQRTFSGSGTNPVRIDGADQHLSWTLLLTGQIRFQFNVDQGLNASLSVVAEALNPLSSLDVVFGHSVYWNGLTDVRDQNGNLLSLALPGQAPGAGQYALATASGLDLHLSTVPSPVPEPGPVVLLMLGLSVVFRRAATALPRRVGGVRELVVGAGDDPRSAVAISSGK